VFAAAHRLRAAALSLDLKEYDVPAFVCPRCHAKTWANDAYGGRDGWCPDCHQRVPVPAILTNPCYRNLTRLRSQPPAATPSFFSPGPDRLARHIYDLVQARIGALAQIELGSYTFDCEARNPGTGTRAAIAKVVIHEAALPGAIPGIPDEVQVWIRATGDAESLEGHKVIRQVWNPTFQTAPARAALFARLDPGQTLAAHPHEGDRFAYFPILFQPGRGFAHIEVFSATAIGTISGSITEDLGPIVNLIVDCAGL
jgi:hypothetical protein